MNFAPLSKRHHRLNLPIGLQEDSARFLEQLVNTNSPTTHAAGVNSIQELLNECLRAMGFQTRYEANPDSNTKSGKLLVGEETGSSQTFVTLVSHADTVLNTDEAGCFTTSEDGSIGRGSGVIDNKGGIVVAFQGLKHFLAHHDHGYSIRVVISPNEEAGSIGFHGFFDRYAADSKIVLGFEPALEDGSIIESRRGNRWYEIGITGQEAHAGRCKGEQINAAHDLGIKIAKLHKLNRPQKGIAVNVARIEGGRDRFNVVCGKISAKLDTRFASFKTRDALHRKIEKILLKPEVTSPVTGRTSQTTYTIEDDCPPFSMTSVSKKYLKVYLAQINAIEGRKVISQKAGGAGDVNYMSREGTVVIDGLGPVGGKMHTTDELILLPSLATRALALAQFLAKLPAEL